MSGRFLGRSVLVACVVLGGCSKEQASAPATEGGSSDETGRRVVLYTSADPDVRRAVVDAFEKRTGIEVLDVGDTEATKTVGLARRLLDERESPRADVWWSNEPFYTIRLAKQGVFEPYRSETSEAGFPGGWPASARGSDGTWYGFAARARVIAYDTRKLDRAEVPRTLRDLAEPRWTGKVGMARPIFGTTVGHMATLVSLWGEEPTRQWLESMEANGLRLYDGNSSVVRAIADGEIELGLTDTDDVWVAQREGWPVGLVYETREIEGSVPATSESVWPLASFGAIVIPNTAAKVAGGPNSAEAEALLDFLTSEACERLLMTSDARNVPLRPEAAGELFERYPETRIDPPADIDLEEAAESIDTARRLVEDVFGL